MCEALAMAHLGSGPELLYALRRPASAAQASVAAVYPLSGSPLRPSSLCLSCSCAPVLTPTLTQTQTQTLTLTLTPTLTQTLTLTLTLPDPNPDPDPDPDPKPNQVSVAMTRSIGDWDASRAMVPYP